MSNEVKPTEEKLTKRQELEKKLAERRKQVANDLEEKVAIAKMNAEMRLLDNPLLQEITAKKTIASENLEKLEVLKVAFEEMDPIKTKKGTREVKVLRSYGLGEEVDQVIGLLGAIRYATDEHKTEMIALTSLDVYSVEQCLDALGSDPYFSKTHKVIVDGIPADVEQFKTYILSVCNTLELNAVSTVKFTQAFFDKRFDSAEVRANEEHENHLRYMRISEDNTEYDV